jgi:CheY-like chemotaxis protein
MNPATLHGPVLVIDDEDDLRDIIADIIADSGRAVATAKNGAEALAKLATLPRPCLILLDLMMPVMDGYNFLDELVRLAADVKVLVISAHAALAAGERYAHLVGTLPKPFAPRQLVSAIEQHC